MIPLIKPEVGEEEIEAIRAVFQSGHIAQGPTTKKFEGLFAQYVGAKHASATTSCTAALHLSVCALGIGRGDEVIVPSFTFPASANAVALQGATPVFCDIDVKTFNVDVKSAESVVTERTKAIMPIHLFGQSADMGGVMRFAKKHNLRVIEDAANSMGTFYEKKHVGTIGDFGCFSFHPRKILTTGEGGMLTAEDDALAAMAASLKDHGKDETGTKFVRAGFNYRMSDILAAIGIVQLNKLDATIKRRKQLAERYSQLLEGASGITPPHHPAYTNHTYQSYVLLLDDGIDRDAVIRKTKEKGVQTQIGTYAVHLQLAYLKKGESIPNAERADRQALTLPMYGAMTDADQQLVVKTLKEALK
ncbi:UDP-4-amino-4-deoxy-L-arabinose--oxoglutarate aminotransferase [Candidatus Norongarragalina meridionalis]|nr:UDP-4-amino-4-deoxy-L-arabinose--oxoglutarate aminotransferase [Candidatus Norongarragalina meridionalis]